MAKYIAHASIDENGTAKNGCAGDQTTKEVCIRTWYPKSWNYVLRIENEEVRIQFANNMIDIAKNNNIGYDQNQRNTLLTQAKKVDFDFSKITVKCECDCSSMVTIALLGAIYIVLGEDAYDEAYETLVVSGNCATTSTLKNRMLKLTMFKVSVYASSDYTDGTSKAVFGDIYNKAGSHVVCYIDTGSKVTKTVTKSVTATDSAKSKDTTLAGTYKVTASWLNVRHGAGAKKEHMVTIPKGTNVKNYGYYTEVDETKWLYVQFTYEGTEYIGFCSSKYLEK